ncbi:MAG: TolC family protein [Candidatus Muiribacteriota bacterium]
MKISLTKLINVFIVAILTSITLYYSLPGRYGFFVFFLFLFLYYAMDRFSKKMACLTGLIAGLLSGIIIYRGFYLYSNLIYFYALSLLGLNLFIFMFFSVYRGKKTGILSFVLFEFLRTLGPLGFASNIGVLLYNTSFARMAAYGGIYVVSFFILLINYSIWEYGIKPKKYKIVLYIVILILIIYALPPRELDSEGRKLNVGVVQGGIPDWMYAAENFDDFFSDKIKKIYTELTEKISTGTDIVIWPETALRDNLFHPKNYFYRAFFENLSRRTDTSYAIGAPFNIDNKIETNSLFFIDENHFKRYDKIITVPIVEDYFKRGDSPETLGNEKFTFVPVICFESIFEKAILSTSALNADFIVVITNDAGFRYSVIKELHAAYSVFRAVEAGKPVIRAAQSGISMIIDDKGNVLKKKDKFETGVLKGGVYITNSNSFYSLNYLYIIFSYFALFVLFFILEGKKKISKKTYFISFLVFLLTLNLYCVDFKKIEQEALKNNAELQKLKNQLKVNQLEIKEAIKKTYPSASIEFQRIDTDTTNALHTATPRKQSDPSALFNMGFPLSADGRLSLNIEINKLKYELNQSIYKARVKDITYSVLEMYIEVLKNYRIYNVSKEIANRAGELLNISKEIYDMGKITRLEYLNAKKEAGRLDYELTSAEMKFNNSFLNLLTEINSEYFEIDSMSDVHVENDFQISFEQLKKNTISNRPEVRIYELEKEIAGMEEKMAEPANQSFINFEYHRAGGFNQAKNEFDFPLSSEGYTFGLFFERPLGRHKTTLTREYEKVGRKQTSHLEGTVLIQDKIMFDLFENGTEKSQIEIKKIEKEYYRRRYENLLNDIVLEAVNSYNRLEAARKLTGVQQEITAYYNEKIQIEEEKYNMGQFSMPDLLESYVESLFERQKYFEALYEYKQAFFALKHNMGELNAKDL